jgi:glycosyltransferase involved in cell wall biosynthesis/2-polyprenyl-3-methyl-5-hydroxy-6-metoxy-1,4-benzoquinol methylase
MAVTDDPREASASARPKLLLIGPVPPPAYGVAKATALMKESPVLARNFEIVHVDTSDRSGFQGIGRLNLHNLGLGLGHVWMLDRVLGKTKPDLALLTASQGRFALLRDALFVYFARSRGASVATYLRGSRYAELRSREGCIAAGALRWIFKHSSVVVVLGESLVDMARQVYPAANVTVVPNGCPRAVADTQVCLRDEDHPVLAYVGRLSDEKGIPDALRAARIIADRVPNLEFVFCGNWDSPAFETSTLHLTDELGLSGTVRFPGPASASERADLLARAWVLLLPSHSEGQPWVIIEAMSAGVPVVATDTGAIADTLGGDLARFVVPVGDIAALVRQTTDLITDDALWRQSASAALQLYEQEFTLERVHTALAEELRHTLTKKKGATSAWFSAYATTFDESYRVSSLFAQRAELWTRLIEAHCPEGGRVVDVGCGSGVFSEVAAGRAGEVLSVDPSEGMLEKCAARCAPYENCSQLRSTVEDLDPEELGTFDLVLASSVLEYVDDLDKSVSVLAGLSRPGGTLIVSLPNTGSLLRKAEGLAYRVIKLPRYYHLVKNLPSAKKFTAMLERAGFSIEDHQVFAVPKPLIAFSRVPALRRRLGTMIVFVTKKRG